MESYPRVLEAVASAEMSLWPVVDAVVAEIASTDAGSAKNGEYERCAAYLAQNGFTSWSSGRLRHFRDVGRWVNSYAWHTNFIAYPFEWVYEAKRAAKSDHEKALKILSKASSKRDIRPDRVNPASMSGEVAAETVARIAKEHPSAVAEAVAGSKETADAVAANAVASARISSARGRRERDATESVAARNFREENPGIGAMRYSARIGEVMTQVRMLVHDYQEVTSANPDLRELLDERTVNLKGDIIIALDTLVGDGVDAALAEILKTEGAGA